jgi:hypothetical protein
MYRPRLLLRWCTADTRRNRPLLSWPITDVPLTWILDVTGIKFENENVKMDVKEYVCRSKGHGGKAICCVPTTVFFLYMPVEKMDKKNKRKHMNSIKLPQASGCIRWLNGEWWVNHCFENRLCSCHQGNCIPEMPVCVVYIPAQTRGS